ncbi:uncharacterized protein LOC123553798 [Mercenaria mercenaria]|uniref:uncharacterized protein LOC123553798 n=1 Tax=Mercenaria mercenaria TaxID=6596 RepID=UPI00234F9A6E|nr:uncharacterized protein LOC123553798 [Mercenaria mercenaria]XP_053404757.1 uncharacterized protein LOC123553798 [Mercenaria mercenaria]XP_053404758.1 uncharacterized protein LOC123553798 [Mercenaria mercenaria]
MDSVPDYYPDVSRRLSQVLDDIGVNERTVNVRRRTGLLRESMQTLSHNVLGGDIKCYHFGTQTEGTTTLGLNSDIDLLTCHNKYNVIQDWGDWKQGKLNLLMIQDDTVPPGYCRLQCLRPDIPVAEEELPDEHFEYDIERRVLLKNTFLHQGLPEGHVRHGPAATNENSNFDLVSAFLCKIWPSEAETWMFRYYAKQSHNVHLIRHSVQSGCFLVPTGHSSSQNERLEWRISTSLAERYIMFNMNVTQIRCYVLLKMIMKTFITPDFPDTISSFYCKTVLMFLVENSQYELWHEDNLLLCVTSCLRLLQNFIYADNCPHYFIPGNNLMAEKFDFRTRQQLIVALEHIMCKCGRALLGIEIDNVGDRLRDKCGFVQARCNYQTTDQTHYAIYSILYYDIVYEMIVANSDIKVTNEVDIERIFSEMKTRLSAVLQVYRCSGGIERESFLLMIPSLCTTMGSLLASYRISQGQSVSNTSLSLFSLGIDSDVATGRLKLASALFCAGDLERTVIVLRDVEERYNPRVTQPLCRCISTDLQNSTWRFPINILHIENVSSLTSYFAFGVSFTRGEVHCVPRALQYEMFRCTEEERAMRDEVDDWMDWAVADPLPYLYYLQYLTYGQLGRQRDQQRALNKLIITVSTESLLFHKETTLNLLGQCMEQEHSLMDALVCYRCSLNERPTHNVARWHIVGLLRKIYH